MPSGFPRTSGSRRSAEGLSPRRPVPDAPGLRFRHPGPESSFSPKRPGACPRPSEWSRPSPSRLGHRIRDLRDPHPDGHGLRRPGQRWEADATPHRQRAQRPGRPDGIPLRASGGPRGHPVRAWPGRSPRSWSTWSKTGRAPQPNLATYRWRGRAGPAVPTSAEGYGDGHYSSFVCFFPVEDPQLVVYREVGSAGGRLLRWRHGRSSNPGDDGGGACRPPGAHRLGSHGFPRPAAAEEKPSPGAQFASSDSLPHPHPSVRPGLPHHPETGAVVPDVSGLSPRLAVRRLHALGFRVRWTLSGPVVGTDPPAHTPLSPGDTVRILVRRDGAWLTPASSLEAGGRPPPGCPPPAGDPGTPWISPSRVFLRTPSGARR